MEKNAWREAHHNKDGEHTTKDRMAKSTVQIACSSSRPSTKNDIYDPHGPISHFIEWLSSQANTVSRNLLSNITAYHANKALCDKYLTGRHPRQAELPSIQCEHDPTTPFYIPILNVFDVSRTQKKKADRFQNFSDSASGGTRGTEERQDPAMEQTREKKLFHGCTALCNRSPG